MSTPIVIVDDLNHITAERDAAIARYEALRAACLIPAPDEVQTDHSHLCALCMADVEPDQPDLHDRGCALYEATP